MSLLFMVAVIGCIAQKPSTSPQSGMEEMEGMEEVENAVPEKITPLEDFFVLDLGIKPDLDIVEWGVEVKGLVDHPLVLTYEDILSLPSVTQITTLYCVTGYEATGEWTGVPVKSVLEMAGYSESAVSVVFYAADGYTSSLTLEKALKEDTLLAYKMNGVTLPKEHGFPLRLVVPDKLGYKWVKWVIGIELVNYEYEGYWESRGYSNAADVSGIQPK